MDDLVEPLLPAVPAVELVGEDGPLFGTFGTGIDLLELEDGANWICDLPVS